MDKKAQDHYFSHDMISEEGRYIELYDALWIIDKYFEKFQKKSKKSK